MGSDLTDGFKGMSDVGLIRRDDKCEMDIGSIIVPMLEPNVALDSASRLYRPTHKIHILLQTQRRIPILAGPDVLCFAQQGVALAIDTTFPVDMMDTIFQSAHLNRHALRDICRR